MGVLAAAAETVGELEIVSTEAMLVISAAAVDTVMRSMLVIPSIPGISMVADPD